MACTGEYPHYQKLSNYMNGKLFIVNAWSQKLHQETNYDRQPLRQGTNCIDHLLTYVDCLLGKIFVWEITYPGYIYPNK